jgi:SPW repeat
MKTIAGGPDRAFNVGMAVLGALLFVSPWLFGFAGVSVAAWNAWIFGAIAALIAVVAALRAYDWKEWLDAIAGIWIAISPWFLGFSGMPAAAWVHVIVGLGVLALAAIELQRLYHDPEMR